MFYFTLDDTNQYRLMYINLRLLFSYIYILILRVHIHIILIFEKFSTGTNEADDRLILSRCIYVSSI